MKSCLRQTAKYSVGVFFCVLFWTSGAKAQKIFSTTDCIEYAFSHNPLLNVAVTEVSIADIGIQRARGTYLPRVDITSAFQYYFNNRILLLEGGNPLAPPSLQNGEPMAVNAGFNNTWYPSMNVFQQIFNPAYRSSYNIALQSKTLQGQQLANFKIDLITGIYKAYNTCKLLELQADFLQKNVTRIDTLLDLTRIKFEEGAGVKIEVNRVEVTRNRMISELANVRNGYNEALTALQFQMNYLEPDSLILEKDFTINEAVSKVDSIAGQLLQSQPSQRIENQVLASQIYLADESIKLEGARGKPVIGADASLGFTPGANSIEKIFEGERWKPFLYVGLNIAIPIFNGFDVKRAVEQKKLQASQSRNYMDQFVNQFENEKKITSIQIFNAYTRYQYADANLKIANNNIELLHEAFINGVADNQDIILGENDLYDNQARYFNELLRLLLYEIDGIKVAGAFNRQAGL